MATETEGRPTLTTADRLEIRRVLAQAGAQPLADKLAAHWTERQERVELLQALAFREEMLRLLPRVLEIAERDAENEAKRAETEAGRLELDRRVAELQATTLWGPQGAVVAIVSGLVGVIGTAVSMWFSMGAP